ncbi:TetR/AcrR family transcriptional regulator [Henriciella sp. AS95]|uniref:TetR/AcrR family transcriptional regulator n=1 Tax=Henriciella sp. AS95 TaxID=3135782 RepID=UPI00316DD62D
MDDQMITPAERRRLRVRDSILEAAERVFADEGEAGLSIRRIADEIDYSPAAIYKYFESKNELVNELKEAFFARILSIVHDMYECSESFPERARACIVGYVNTALEKPHHYIAAFSAQAPLKPAASDDEPISHTNRARAFLVLVGLVEEGVETGHFRADLPLVDTANALWASMHGVAMMMAQFPTFPDMSVMQSSLSRDAFVEYHADLTIRGLEARPGASRQKRGD